MPPVKKPPHTRQKTFMKEWRKYRKLSQEKAAQRVEVDRTTLGRIEKGQLPYNQDFLERLALAYGCEAADILDMNPMKPDAPRLVYDRLKDAPKAMQDQAIRVLDALLKTGS